MHERSTEASFSDRRIAHRDHCPNFISLEGLEEAQPPFRTKQSLFTVLEMDPNEDRFTFEHSNQGPLIATDSILTPSINILNLIDPGRPIEIQDREGSLTSKTTILASMMTARHPATEATCMEEACFSNKPDDSDSKIFDIDTRHKHIDNSDLYLFRVPTCIEDVQLAAHKLNDPPTVFPRDNDSYHVVRRFLYTTLTSEAWGIVEVCPVAIIATVKRWYGAGSYLRERYKRGDLRDLCPLAAINGTIDDPERICDLIATCVMQECRLHLERTIQRKQEGPKAQHNIESEIDGAKIMYEPGRVTSRPKLPEEWTPRKRRSSSVYSKTSNGTPLRVPIGRRLYSTEVIEQKSLTKRPSSQSDTITESASHQENSILDHSTQRPGSSLRLISSLRSIKGSLNSDQDSTTKSLPLKRGLQSMQNLWDTFSNPHTLRLKSSKTFRSNECKTIRFEDAKEGPLPAIDEGGIKEKAYPDPLLTSFRPESDAEVDITRSSKDRPTSTPQDTVASPELTEILSRHENHFNHVMHPSYSDSDLKSSRGSNTYAIPLDRSKRMSWHLGDAASENGVLFLSTKASSESLAVRSASPVGCYSHVNSEILLPMDEIDAELTIEEAHDSTNPLSEREDDCDLDSLFDEHYPERQPRDLTLREFLSQETLNNNHTPPTASTSVSKGNAISDTLCSIQKRLWRPEKPQAKTNTKMLGSSATRGPSHGPMPRFKDFTDDVQRKRREHCQHKALPPVPPAETSMSRKLGRGVAKALRPLKPARFQ